MRRQTIITVSFVFYMSFWADKASVHLLSPVCRTYIVLTHSWQPSLRHRRPEKAKSFSWDPFVWASWWCQTRWLTRLRCNEADRGMEDQPGMHVRKWSELCTYPRRNERDQTETIRLGVKVRQARNSTDRTQHFGKGVTSAVCKVAFPSSIILSIRSSGIIYCMPSL